MSEWIKWEYEPKVKGQVIFTFMSGLFLFHLYCNFNHSKVDLPPRFQKWGNAEWLNSTWQVCLKCWISCGNSRSNCESSASRYSLMYKIEYSLGL